MIKIEITDPHSMGYIELKDLAFYLNVIADSKHKQPEPVPVIPPIGSDSLSNTSPEIQYLKNITESHHQESRPIIEENLIPVPPEVVNIPEPSVVFSKPIESLVLSSVNSNPSIELDSQGLPWDFRIHARTKTKNKDGSWKRLRGVSNNTAEKIETELKEVQAIPAPIAPAVPAPPTEQPKDFAAMMTIITDAITAKKIERHHVNKVLNQFGIPSIPVAASRPDLIPGIIMALEEIINEG